MLLADAAVVAATRNISSVFEKNGSCMYVYASFGDGDKFLAEKNKFISKYPRA